MGSVHPGSFVHNGAKWCLGSCSQQRPHARLGSIGVETSGSKRPRSEGETLWGVPMALYRTPHRLRPLFWGLAQGGDKEE